MYIFNFSLGSLKQIILEIPKYQTYAKAKHIKIKIHLQLIIFIEGNFYDKYFILLISIVIITYDCNLFIISLMRSF